MKTLMRTLILFAGGVLAVSTTALAAEGVEAERKRLYRNLSDDPNLNTPAEIEERIDMRFKTGTPEKAREHSAMKAREQSQKEETAAQRTRERLLHRNPSDRAHVNTRKEINKHVERKFKTDMESQCNAHAVAQRFEALEKPHEANTAAERERRRLLYRDANDRADLNTLEEIEEWVDMKF